jgi:PhoH-like ATPase
MTKSIVIDTNLLLDDPKIIYKLSTKYDKIIIPLTIIKELDKHKLNPNLSYSARSAISEIIQFKHLYPDKLILSVGEHELSIDSNDLKIIQSALDNNAELCTKDMSMSIISEAKGIKTKLYGTVLNGLHNPYIIININDINNEFNFAQEYNNSVTIAGKEIMADQWRFIFIEEDVDKVVYIYATNPIDNIIQRIDNIPQYRNIKTEGKHIKANDRYQICAIYAFKTAPCVVLTGKWGSGKSLLATSFALNEAYNKIFITRPPVGINAKYDIGFLPGDKFEKMFEYFAGFVSSLYYIYANTKGQTSNKDGFISYDYVKEKIFREKFEGVPINAIQGLSILENDIFVADEIQLITIDMLSMLLSRANKNSKLILLGDLSQTYSVIRPSESGLLKLMHLLPDPAICHVDLKVSYRSDLVRIADKLQDVTVG